MEKNKTKYTLILSIILLAYVLLCLIKINDNNNSDRLDQSSYIELTLDIKNFKLLADGARHPLYSFFLLPFAERSVHFFTSAKIISLLIGVITLLLYYLLLKKELGKYSFLLFVLLLVYNDTIVHLSSYVKCEILFIFLTFCGWYFLYKGLSNDKLLIYSGVFSGLSYLAKSSGTILLLSFLITTILIKKTKIFRSKYFYYSIIIHFLISSPVLLYNNYTYKNPFYNVNTTHLFWADSYEHKVNESIENFTFQNYLKSHNLRDWILRPFYGIIRMSHYTFNTLISNDDTRKYPVMGYLGFAGTCLLFLYLWYKSKEGNYLLISFLVVFLIYFISFAWFSQLLFSARFIAPLIPIFYFTVLLFIKDSLNIRIKKIVNNSFIILIIFSILFFGTVVYLNFSKLKNPYSISYFTKLDKIKRNILNIGDKGNIKLLRGNFLISYKFNWLLKKDNYFNIEKFNKFSELQETIKSKQIKYIYLDINNFVSIKSKRLFYPYFITKNSEIFIQKIPENWKLISGPVKHPFEFYIFEIE